MKFELQIPQKSLTDSELIADVARIAKQRRLRTVSCINYIRYGKYAKDTLSRRFGSWMNVQKLAGLQTTRYCSTADLFWNMKKVWSSLGRQPRLKEMVKPFSRYSAETYRYAFGTWKKALEWFVRLANNPKFQKKGYEIPALLRKRSRRLPRTLRLRLGQRFEVLRRDNYKCRACGKSPATHKGIILHIDHIKPLAKGGKTVLKNLQTLCGDCNIGKGNR
jgi:HNH endonuclease